MSASSRRRVFIAGAGGMLGQAFYEQFSRGSEVVATDKDVNEPWLGCLDFRDLDEYRRQVRDARPDCLFHIGALTDLEYCEAYPDDAYATNTLAVENAIYIANELDIPLLYISTAGIFDGRQDTYDDWDTPSPLGVYARSKYMGELAVQRMARRHLICRAGWMMGGGPRKDKKFINKLIRQIEAGKRELMVVHDKLGVPTYTHDFAATVRVLIERELWGVYNLVCQGLTGRVEVARELVRQLGLDHEVKVTAVPSSYWEAVYSAPRPASERLLNRKLELRGINGMRPWDVALADYLRRDFAALLKPAGDAARPQRRLRAASVKPAVRLPGMADSVPLGKSPDLAAVATPSTPAKTSTRSTA